MTDNTLALEVMFKLDFEPVDYNVYEDRNGLFRNTPEDLSGAVIDVKKRTR